MGQKERSPRPPAEERYRRWREALRADPAYRAIAEDEDLDIVLHLGDYIYEYGPDPESTRTHETAGPTDLDSYRNRYAEYRMDPALQAAHAMHPGSPSRTTTRCTTTPKASLTRIRERRRPCWPTGSTCP
jgi:hypothetical protein